MSTPASTVSQPATGWRQLIDPNTATGWNPVGSPGNPQRNDYSVPLPVGTPIVAPVSGVVLPQHTSGGGYYSYYGPQPWGGEVDVLTSMSDYPNGLQNVNILHFDTINVQPGDTVIAGQTVLGTSGGQNSGGHMPSSPTYSTGPHIGIGVHSVQSWDTMWNPLTLINDLLGGQDTSSLPSNNQIQGAGLGGIPRNNQVFIHAPDKSGSDNNNNNNNDPCSQYNGIDPRYWWCKAQSANLPLRFGKFVLGSFLIIWGIGLFLVGSLGSDIAAAATTAAGVPEAAPFAARAAGRRTSLTRRVGAGIRTRGALAGKETLKKTEARGEQAGTQKTVEAFHLQAVERSRRGQVTGGINKEREQLGFDRLTGKQMQERGIGRSSVLTPEERRELEERDALQKARAERRKGQYQGMQETLRQTRGEPEKEP